MGKHSNDQMYKIVQTKWEKYCTRKNVDRARKDVEEIIKKIHKVAKVDKYSPFIAGFQHTHATVIR